MSSVRRPARRCGCSTALIVNQCLFTGDYDEAVRFGHEALSLARTLGDRSIEVVATSLLGGTHAARGEFSDVATLLERKVALEGDRRFERFGAPAILSAVSGARLADALSQLAGFDEPLVHRIMNSFRVFLGCRMPYRYRAVNGCGATAHRRAPRTEATPQGRPDGARVPRTPTPRPASHRLLCASGAGKDPASGL